MHSYAFSLSLFLRLSGLKVEENHGVHRGWDFNIVSVFLFDKRARVVSFDVRFRTRSEDDERMVVEWMERGEYESI